MRYDLARLAPGSYDLLLNGEVVASLVRSTSPDTESWFVELLDETGPRPPPFCDAVHEFASFAEAAQWLGNPEQVSHAA